MARYIVLCNCTGPGDHRRIVGVIDDNRTKDGRVRLHGSGIESVFAPHAPNRHRKYLSYRLFCPRCPRKLRWAENTVHDVMAKIAPHRHELETVELPHPHLHLLRAVRAGALSAEEVTPGDICKEGTRYVIPFGHLCRVTSKLDKSR